MIVIQTDHFVNKTVTECFAHGSKARKINIKDYEEIIFVNNEEDLIKSIVRAISLLASG